MVAPLGGLSSCKGLHIEVSTLMSSHCGYRPSLGGGAYGAAAFHRRVWQTDPPILLWHRCSGDSHSPPLDCCFSQHLRQPWIILMVTIIDSPLS
jgi:hypothetical protein